MAGEFQDEVSQELRNLGDFVVMMCKVELEDVKYTGALAGSFVVEVDAPALSVRIFPTARHAVYVRKGTRPHWARIEPLKRWAAAKLGSANAGYAVQRSIAKRGTSVFQLKLRGTKQNPWPNRVVTNPSFNSALKKTAKQIGGNLVATS